MWHKELIGILDRILSDPRHIEKIPWKDVCENPWIPFEYIRDRCPYPKYFSYHPGFPLEDGSLLPYADWVFLSRTCPIPFLLAHLGDRRCLWKFEGLCQNPGMTPQIMDREIIPFLSFDVLVRIFQKSMLFQHPHFSVSDLKRTPYSLKNLRGLCRHPGFRPEWFDEIPRRRWNEFDWHALSRNPGIPMDFIKKTWRSLPWSVPDLSFHPHLDIHLVLQNRQRLWDWNGVSLHITLPEAIFAKKHFPLRFKSLSKNLHLRIWFIHRFLSEKWDFLQLAVHPALKPKDILRDKILFPLWRWDYICQNPSMDMATFQELKKQIKFPLQIKLLKNHFYRDPRYLHLQALRIQSCFRKFVYQKKQTRRIHLMQRVVMRLDPDCWETIKMFL